MRPSLSVTSVKARSEGVLIFLF